MLSDPTKMIYPYHVNTILTTLTVVGVGASIIARRAIKVSCKPEEADFDFRDENICFIGSRMTGGDAWVSSRHQGVDWEQSYTEDRARY